MTLHRWLDVVAIRNMWRYRRPPVESTPADVERLLAIPDADLHPPAAAPEIRWAETRRTRGVIAERFSFPSPAPDLVRTGDAAVDTVSGLRFRGAGAEHARTALVIVHGAYAGSHSKPLWFLPPPARAPWDTVSMELPHHMTRQRPDSRYSGQFMVTADVPRLVRGMVQAEADVRALVEGLRALGYGRIVLGGISLGGNAALTAAIRAAVDGVFAITPAIDAYRSLWLGILGKCIRPAGRAAGITDETARSCLRLITPTFIGTPAIPGERVLVAYGRHDLLCRPEVARALSRAWGGCAMRPLDAGHASLVLAFWKVRRLVAAWVRAVTGAVS